MIGYEPFVDRRGDLQLLGFKRVNRIQYEIGRRECHDELYIGAEQGGSRGCAEETRADQEEANTNDRRISHGKMIAGFA